MLNGRIEPEGIDLICTNAQMNELGWRQLKFKEFEVSELSLSSLLIARSHGDETWVGLPVFSTRHFFHTGILVREGAGITEPSQLVGKRIGVPEYQQTAALWGRGVLQHEFGIDPTSLQWFMERLPDRSHGGATGFQPPVGIDLTYIPEDKNIGGMLLSGELDASLFYINSPNFVDRSTAVFGAGSGVTSLFQNQRGEATRYFSKTGIIPMNHIAVVRKDVVDRHPWTVLNLYSAFRAARQIAREESRRELGGLVDVELLEHPMAKSFASDPFPYGIAANRETLETAFAYSYEQGLSARRMQLEEIFYPATLEL
jgi:4,5-dihydroxyphthalate decarboxylase